MIAPDQKPGKLGLSICSVASTVGHPWAGSFVLAACLSLLGMETAQAMDIPSLSVMQPEIAATHPELVTQREALLKERKALLDRTNRHNASCDTVEVGSAADASCTKAYASLETAISNHVQASQRYNEHYFATVNLAAQTKPVPPLPSSDPNVVDARNVPSGLSESVDKAIPHTPSGDNVRKGFQAIQAGDWEAALAWFQVARNIEPSNSGIERLVDLADFTLEYRTRAKPLASSAPVATTQLPKQNSVINSTGDAVAKSGDPAVEPRGDDFMGRMAATQIAARARAAAAVKKYEEKYGDHNFPARNRVMQEAARGEGYSDQELKTQLRDALIEFRKNHPRGQDAPFPHVSPAVEDISIGGKG